MDNDDNPDGFSDADKEAIADMLTDDDLRDRSQALHEAQEKWEKLAYVTVKKIPCRECGGAGSVASGGFGDICVACMGTRLEEAPDAEDFEMPDFGKMRLAISAYGNALADLALPDPEALHKLRRKLRDEHDRGHHAGMVGERSGRCTFVEDGQRCPFGEKIGGPQVGQAVRRGLALPPTSSVPTMEAIRAIDEQAKAQLKQLGGAPGVVPPAQLPAPKKAKGLTGEGDLGEYEDQELDEMIAEAEEV